MPETLTELSRALAAYCNAQGLPYVDVIELLHVDLTGAQRDWLSAFCLLWELTESEGEQEADDDAPCPIHRQPQWRCPASCNHGV
jgi:hypothetical protein